MNTYSKKAFCRCVLCGQQTDAEDDRLTFWINRAIAGKIYKWTRCEYCNTQYRQKYNTYLHMFTDPDVKFAIR